MLPYSIRLAAAAAGLSLLTFLLLLAGHASRLPIGIAAIVCLLLAGRPPRPSFPRTWALIPLLLFGGYYLIHALAPEIQPDGYTYHLGLVAEWVRLGGFPDRIGFYEMLPQGLEMLFLGGYLFAGATGAKLIHFAFLVGTVPLLFALARRLGLENWHAAAAAILYFCAPVAGVAGSSAYNDAALVFYTLAAFYLLLDWRQQESHKLALLLGATAGFCYGIKMTGAVVVPAVLLVMAGRRRWKALALAAAAAALMIAPWMIRNAVLTGNPIAPLGNRLFPNPYFHVAAEDSVASFLRSYRVPPATVPLELAVRGFRLQGLIGPVFLLAPLALLAVRRREGRCILAAAAVALLPWTMNIGARFLMPALPLLGLALTLALPRRAVLALAAAHAVAATPWALDLYTEQGAWRLRGLPWRAALRLEPEADYLRRALWEYRAAEMIRAHVPARRQFLDLVGAPSAYIDAVAVGPWQAARAGRAFDALAIAAIADHNPLHSLEASWDGTPVTAIRFEQSRRDDWFWSIQEVELLRGQETLPPTRRWQLDAWPNPWEAPRALDRNPASRWSSWEPMRPGMFFEVDFGQPERLIGARLVCLRREGKAHVEVHGRAPDGGWRKLAAMSPSPRPRVNMQRQATRILRREGFQWVLAKIGADGWGPISREMVDHPDDWDLKVVANVESVYLLRVM